MTGTMSRASFSSAFNSATTTSNLFDVNTTLQGEKGREIEREIKRDRERDKERKRERGGEREREGEGERGRGVNYRIHMYTARRVWLIST